MLKDPLRDTPAYQRFLKEGRELGREEERQQSLERQRQVLFETIIPLTIAELVTISPNIIVPGHCTGWKATHELARQSPGAYVQTSVGTRLHFG